MTANARTAGQSASSAKRYLVAALLLLCTIALALPTTLLANGPFLRYVQVGFALAGLLLGPGLLLQWIKPKTAEPSITLFLAPILSLALFPLALLWVDLAGGRWTAWIARYAVCATLIADLVFLIVYKKHASSLDLAGLTLALTFAGALAIRLYQVREFLLPSWLDSYHHTLITQIIRDSGRIPKSYAPYSDLSGFNYHFGFHAYAAFAAWASRLATPLIVIIAGQVLNALVVPSLYVSTYLLSKDKLAGLLAGLVAGIVCRNPAHYVNWGRYPQLMGQTLLPVALALLVSTGREAIAQKKLPWPMVLLSSVAAAGLVLSHYRVAIFYGAASFVWLGAILLFHINERGKLLNALGALLLAALCALLLALPWLYRVGLKTGETARVVHASSSGQLDYLSLDMLLHWGLRLSSLIALLVAALWTVIRRPTRHLAIGILAATALCLFLANSNASGIPAGFLSNSAVSMALYLPTALLVGLSASDLWLVLERGITRLRAANSLLGRCVNLARWAIASGLLIVVSLYGGRQLLARGIEPDRHFATQADLQAMNWIRENTPPDSVFVIQGRAWLNGYVANDAGYWLPYLAQRRTTIPPMIYISEGSPAYMAEKNEALRQIATASSAAKLSLVLREIGADYLFLASKPAPGYTLLVDPSLLLDEGYFTLLYHNDGARLYEPHNAERQ